MTRFVSPGTEAEKKWNGPDVLLLALSESTLSGTVLGSAFCGGRGSAYVTGGAGWVRKQARPREPNAGRRTTFTFRERSANSLVFLSCLALPSSAFASSPSSSFSSPFFSPPASALLTAISSALPAYGGPGWN